MGRELGINRIDFLDNGKAIIRHSDFNLCGRTDFTNAITNLFYGRDKNLNYLIVKLEKGKQYFIDEIKKVEVETEDDYWEDKTFEMEYSFVYESVLQEILDDHMKKDEQELERERIMMADARAARVRALNVNIFNDFSDLIDQLQEHINDYDEEAKAYNEAFKEVKESLSKPGKDGDGEPKVISSHVLLVYSE